MFASALSFLRMFARAVSIASRKTFRKPSGWIGVTRQEPSFSRSVSDIIPWRAKPEMSGIAARRIVTAVKNADAFWSQLGFIGKRHASCELIGYPMGETDFASPLNLAIPIAARADKWPASVTVTH
jgi:hypothetical protein